MGCDRFCISTFLILSELNAIQMIVRLRYYISLTLGECTHGRIALHLFDTLRPISLPVRSDSVPSMFFPRVHRKRRTECLREQYGVELAQIGVYEQSSDDDSGLTLIIETSIASLSLL